MTVIKINALTVPAEMGAGESPAPQPPMPIQAELWSFDVAISSVP